MQQNKNYPKMKLLSTNESFEDLFKDFVTLRSFRKLRGHAQIKSLIQSLRPDTQTLKKAA